MRGLRSRMQGAGWAGLVLSWLLAGGWGAATAQTPSELPIALAERCNPLDPVLGGLDNGGFVAAWVTGFNTFEPGIRVRRWDRRGAAVGPEHFTPRLEGRLSSPTLAVSPTGAFAVVWTEPEEIRLWRFDAQGRPRGLPIPIPGPLASRQVRIVADGEGGFLVVWFTHQMHIARIDADDRISRVDVPAAGGFGTSGLRRFAISRHPDGDLLLLQQVDPPNVSSPISLLTALRIPLADPESSQIFFRRDAPFHRGLVLGVDGRGRTVVAWNDGGEIAYQRFGLELQPLAAPVSVATSPRFPVGLEDLGLALDGEGNLALAWSQRQPPGSDELFRIVARGLGADDAPLGPTREVAVERLAGEARQPTLAVTGPAEVIASWSLDIRSRPLSPVFCNDSWLLSARRLAIAGDHALLLAEGRFRVEVEWRLSPPSTSSGRGHALPGSDDTGRFWFFDPANVELVTKVIGGRPVNGHFWFFYGALSNVGYRITVTDQRTGRVKTYDNPPGRLSSFADTFAFPAP